MMNSKSVLSCAVLLFTTLLGTGVARAGGGDADAAAERAKIYNTRFSAPADALNRPVGISISGVRNLKTVMPGVLYRAGGAGGQTAMSQAALQGLCEAGFTKAYYLYPEGFKGPKEINCTGPDGNPNTFNYVYSDYITQEAKNAVMAEIHKHIVDASLGPILVHCWNGFHASGEMSATALRQFCGYSVEEAQNYWMNNQRGAKMISRIRKFEPVKAMEFDLDVPSDRDLKSAVCPK